MKADEERALVHRAKKDPDAFARLYDEYYSKILNYVLRRIGTIDAAQDVTAETFFKALDKLWQFRWQGVPFSAWLYRIATNEVHRYFRSGGRTTSLEALQARGFEPAAPHTPEDELARVHAELERHRAFLAYQEAINRLDSKYQDVLTLRFFEHKTFGEIAEILKKPEGTVKSLAHRGLELLRRVQPFEEERVIEDKPQSARKGETL